MESETTLSEKDTRLKGSRNAMPGIPDGLALLEEPTRLSRSKIWDLQRSWYENQGPAAWSLEAVPNFPTTNNFIARAFARQIEAFLRDAADTGLDADEPIYLLELGAGSGRFGFHCLHALLERTDLDKRRICYVLTDLAASNVELWRQHPQLVPLAERGVLDFARFDAETDDRLTLLQSGDELVPGSQRNPVVAIANGVFGSLRQDAFAVVDGRLLECRLTLTGRPGVAANGWSSLDGLHIDHEYRPVDLPYYDDPFLDDLLEEYRQKLGSGHVTLPLAAWNAVRRLSKLSPRGLLLLTADMGRTSLDALRDAPPPHPSRHGGIALEVNDHALGRWIERLGGEVLRSRTPHALVAVQACLLGDVGETPKTRRAAADTLDNLDPDAFFALKRHLDRYLDEMTLDEVLAYLKLAAWDAHVTRLALPRLQELATAGLRPFEGKALANAVERIWAAHLHLGEAFDLAFELGTVLEATWLHGPAIELFQRSLERYGEHTATFFNLALCHFRLREWRPAHQCIARALDLDPDNAAARELQLKIQAAVEQGMKEPIEDNASVAVKKDVAISVAAYASNLEHLRGELALLNLRLRKEIARWRTTHPPEASPEELAGSRLTDLGADVALDGLGDAAELLGAPGGDPFATLAPRSALHAERERAAEDAGVHLCLPEIVRLFGLDDFERGAVVLALAPELDHRYERLFGYLNDDMQRRFPTVRLALRIFAAAPEERATRASRFDEEAPLRARRLLRIFREETSFPVVDRARGLRLEPGLRAVLLGEPDGLAADPHLTTALEPHDPGKEPPVGDEVPDRAAVDELRALLEDRPEPSPILHLHGPDNLLTRHVAAHLTSGPILVLRGATVAATADPEDVVARALRETILTGKALLVEQADALRQEGKPAQALRRLLTAKGTPPRLLATAEAWPLPELDLEAPVLSLQVKAPDLGARQELWRRALGELAEGLDVAALADRFRLMSAQIDRAARDVRSRWRDGSPEELGRKLFAACRAQCSVSLEGLAQRIESIHTWDDLIVPRQVEAKLRSIEHWLRFRHVVYGEWGFADRVSVGRGMAAMFAGPSGTGKTMAAGILGRALDLDLYRIDLSSVISKYIGETEKNLSKIFDTAQAANAILFFDEADALFGKRSDVKDSHDRHANIEVSYLLQRMESFDGISILATNIKDNLDVAFARRLQTIVEFPFPSVADRERMWRRLLTEQVPQAADVDLPALAQQFALSGGSIKNCALDAALAAAAEEKAVAMRHLVRAVAREYEKLGKPVAGAAFGRWENLV